VPQPRPQLRLVDPRTGELTDKCPTCAEWSRKYNGVLSQLGQMRAAMDADRNHELFPDAKRLFDFWKERCNHPRSEFTPERFKECLPHLRDLGEATCRRAIEGAAFDCYTTTRKNGTIHRHDGWSLIFRSREKVEDFANRAPYHLPDPEDIVRLANALKFVWGWEIEKAHAEATRRLS
jgi:hypothetical protein